MEATLTIRLSKARREALRRRAAAEGRRESTLVREIIAREIDRGFDFEVVRHLAGRGQLKRRASDSWRNRIRDRNWRG